ncbi:HD domain-containing protein [Oceanobacillus sp. CAU 1775]
MNKETIISETEKMVRHKLLHEQTGHDWFHIERVTKNALEIGIEEEADLFVVHLAALLHDLADDKVVESEAEGLKSIEAWLIEQQVTKTDIDHILRIIQTISFKGGNFKKLESLEAKVVQDADRLDAIGAIGIARCFVYSGSKGQAIYDPSLEVRDQMSVEEYRKGESSAIHHFYEKLLKLKDLMNTKTGREMANERHRFMESFLEQFYNEVGHFTQ